MSRVRQHERENDKKKKKKNTRDYPNLFPICLTRKEEEEEEGRGVRVEVSRYSSGPDD